MINKTFQKVSILFNFLSCLSYFISLFLFEGKSLNITFSLSSNELLILKIISAISILVFLFNEPKRLQSIRGCFLIPLSLIGITFFFGATELILKFVSLVFVSISGLFSIVFADRSSSRETAVNYLVLNSIAIVFFLMFCSLFFASTETLSIVDFQIKDHTLYALSLLFLFFTLLFNLGSFPFHTWLPLTMSNLNGKGMINLFLIEKLATNFSLLVLFQELLVENDPVLQSKLLLIVKVIVVANILYGTFVTFSQKSIKRQISYTYISYMSSFLLFCCFEPNEIFELQLFWSMLVFSCSLAGALYCLDVFFQGKDLADEYEALKGRGQSNKFLSITLCLCLASLLAFPLTAGFSTRYVIFSQYFAQSLLWESFTILICMAIITGSYAKLVFDLFIQKKPLHIAENTNFRTRFIQFLFIIVIVGGGLRPFII